MKTLSTILILVAALINSFPVLGVLSASGLESAYGISIDNSNLEILMRHRALLFGVVGGLLFAAALHPPLRPIGFAVGMFNMLSFIFIALAVGGPNAELTRVMGFDLAGIVTVSAAWLLDRREARARSEAHNSESR